jgi:hypothetical protein
MSGGYMDDDFSPTKAEPSLDDVKSVKAANLNRLFFTAGLIGLPICIVGSQRWHHFSWLIGVGLFSYLIVSSITDAVVRTRRDFQEHKKRTALQHSNVAFAESKAIAKRSIGPLHNNPYFRAGVMGLPFCIFEWFWKHEPVFLLGGGFFVGILAPTIYTQWRRTQSKEQAK